MSSAVHLDAIVPSSLSRIAAQAATTEAAGFDGAWLTETANDVLLPATLAAAATERITVGTSIAVALARTPMTTAYGAWDLNGLAGGRFVLGLGSQIRPHIEKRFSMPWSHPAPRMREYVAALHAIWDAWEHGTKLDFRGDFYSHTLMTPMFTPERNDAGRPKVFLAAVEQGMVRVAAEVADGLIVHPFSSSRYLSEVVLPAVDQGRAGHPFEVSAMPIVVTGTTEEAMASAAASARKQLAFYASTPGYRRVLDVHGWGDLQPELHRLSKEARWDEMGGLLDDDMLDAFAVVAPPEELGSRLSARFGGVADRVAADFRHSGGIEAAPSAAAVSGWRGPGGSGRGGSGRDRPGTSPGR